MITHSQNEILSCLAAALFHSSYTPSPSADWEEILREAREQTVLTLVYPVLRDILSPKIREKWENRSLNTLAANIRIDYEHGELHELMIERSVPYTTVKGLCSASYYPDPLKRMMGDVDFLVAPEDLSRAGSALEERGILPRREHNEDHHIEYFHGAVCWEMHFSINGIPDNDKASVIQHYLADVIERSQLIEINGMSCRVPSPFHHGLIMLLHIVQHQTVRLGGICLASGYKCISPTTQ